MTRRQCGLESSWGAVKAGPLGLGCRYEVRHREWLKKCVSLPGATLLVPTKRAIAKVPWVAPQLCPHSEYQLVRKRGIALRRNANFRACELVGHTMRAHLELDGEEVRPMPLRQWMARATGAKRARWEEGAREAQRGTRDRRAQIFTKDELVARTADATVNAGPRGLEAADGKMAHLISDPGPRRACGMGPWVTAMEARLKKGKFRFLLKGMRSQQKNRRVRRMLENKGGRPVKGTAIGFDGAAWDSCVHAQLLAYETEYFHARGCPRKAMAEKVATTASKTYKGKKKAKYRVRMRRKSGDSETSLGNSLLNAWIQLSAVCYARTGDLASAAAEVDRVMKDYDDGGIRVFSEGDDGLVIVEETLLPEELRRYSDFLYAVGLEPKLELGHCQESQWLPEFCSMNFNLKRDEPMPVMKRALGRATWSTKVMAHKPKDVQAFTKLKGLSLQAEWGHVPLLGELGRKMASVADGRITQQMVERAGHAWQIEQCGGWDKYQATLFGKSKPTTRDPALWRKAAEGLGISVKQLREEEARIEDTLAGRRKGIF